MNVIAEQERVKSPKTYPSVEYIAGFALGWGLGLSNLS